MSVTILKTSVTHAHQSKSRVGIAAKKCGKSKLNTFLATAVLAATFGCAAQANVAIDVDWNVNKGTVKNTQLGLGLWAGMDPAVASIQNYKNGIGFIGAPLTRYHAGEQVYGVGGRSWLDSNGNWIASRAQSVFDSTNYGQDKLVNIANWPPNMDTNNDGKLDSDKFAQYADWCKQLVTIMNGSGRYVKYWEPLNEKDGNYQGDAGTLATIFKMARAKMREADSSIQVGGGVFSNPWGDSLIDGFLDGVGTEIDFFSYHHYGSGSSGGSDTDMYNNAESLRYCASGLRNKLVRRGLNIPMLNGEHNMYDTWDKDTNGFMRSSKSAVWDALFFKGMAEGSDADMLASFNDADYTYGKLDPSNNNFTPRPSAYFMKLSRENLIGNIAQTVSSDNASVQGFAVYNDTKHTLALINRTGYAQYVNTGFAGWSPSSTGYTEHRISADETNGYGSSARSWSGAPQNLYMPPHSVYLLQFTGNSRAGGQQPFGGTARALPGRIQAEDYDNGGKFVAYYDDSIGNAGNSYRTDHVDIYPTTDAGGGYKIGNISSKEFWRYTVNVPAGTYDIKLRAASYWGTYANAITVKLGGTTLGSVGVNQTWNDDGFTDAVLTNVNVPSNLAGNGKVLEIVSNSGGFNLNWIEFNAVGVVNLISNPSFENEQYYTQTPSGWNEWGSIDAGYSESYGGAHSGNYHGTHWSKNGSYRVYSYQDKTGLANGLYTLSCWAKNGGGQYDCYLEAKDFGGASRTANLPVTGEWGGWTKVVINDINVSNGQCTIGVWSNANIGNWCFFDDFEFFKQSAGAGSAIPIGQRISLKALNNNLFVMANQNNGSTLQALAGSVGTWEPFTVVDAGGGFVALQAAINGKYVMSDQNNGSTLKAISGAIGSWEKFTWQDLGSNTFALKAGINNNYVQNNTGVGSGTLIAQASTINDNGQKFLWAPAP